MKGHELMDQPVFSQCNLPWWDKLCLASLQSLWDGQKEVKTILEWCSWHPHPFKLFGVLVDILSGYGVSFKRDDPGARDSMPYRYWLVHSVVFRDLAHTSSHDISACKGNFSEKRFVGHMNIGTHVSPFPIFKATNSFLLVSFDNIRLLVPWKVHLEFIHMKVLSCQRDRHRMFCL
jgi:hypothetical protein